MKKGSGMRALFFTKRERNALFFLFLLFLTQTIYQIINQTRQQKKWSIESRMMAVWPSFLPARMAEEEHTNTPKESPAWQPFPSKNKKHFEKKTWTYPSHEYEKEEQNTLAPSVSEASSYPATALIDLNSADSALLEALPAIGPYLAGKIARYRNALGGFHSFNQLLEIKNFHPETLTTIEKYLRIDEERIQSLSINKADVVTLSLHPYLSFAQAKVIVAYRTQHGPYRSAEALRSTILVDAETIKKLQPYLAGSFNAEP
jgi:DNA uptake protein ComE-like DNA-binding protein